MNSPLDLLMAITPPRASRSSMARVSAAMLPTLSASQNTAKRCKLPGMKTSGTSRAL